MANKLIPNLSGGINSKTSPLILKDTECEVILNYNLDTLGALTKRLGYIAYASRPVAANKTCYGLYQYTNSDTSNETTQVYVANNSGDTQTVIYYNSSGTWTSSLATLTASLKTRFATFLNYVFAVNGTDAMTSSINVNGGAWGTTNCVTGVYPKFISVFQDRIYCARGSAASHKSRVWFSSLPSTASTPVITWDTTNDYFDINPDDGDEITALENNGNRLLMFKNRALYRWTYGTTEPDRLLGMGTSSQECVKTNFDLGLTFFANDYGVYAYGGERPKLISRKIQKYIDAVSDWTNVFGEVDNDHYYLFVGDLSVDIDGTTRTLSNAMLVYHISLDAWTVYTLGTKVTWMARLIATSPIEGIYFGDNTGRTYQFLSGTSDLTAGSATDIHGEILTKEYLLQMPNETSVQDVTVMSTQRVNAVVKYQLDRAGDWKPLKSLINRFTRLFMPKIGKCCSIRFKVYDSSKNTSVIEGFNIKHSPLPDE